MMKNKSIMSIVFIIGFIIALLWQTPATLAASTISFDPSVLDAQKDKEIEVRIAVNTDQNVFGADAVISYPTSDLEVTSITNGGFFTDFHSSNTGAGKIEVHGFFANLYESKKGSGNVATIRFKSKKDTGGSVITFVCTGHGNDTQLLNDNGTNILICGNLNNVEVTYSKHTDSTPTNTPTPTTTSGGSTSNSTPACSSITLNPEYGKVPLTTAINCSVKDSDGTISGVEFVFGDGKKQYRDKYLGKEGSITVAHTYEEDGTYTVSCKAKDNRGAYSQSCSTTLTVGTNPATPTPTKTKSSNQTALLSPYIKPTIPPLETYALPSSTDQPSGIPWWWYLFPFIAIIGTILIVVAIRSLPKSSKKIRIEHTHIPGFDKEVTKDSEKRDDSQYV